mmetsp:Transcript_28277/g.76608  ORF Transcript_28277/g.76608 Transcript_28277/m.76608 type:complete len:1073 (-) Transcript_28277:247-3465(-)
MVVRGKTTTATTKATNDRKRGLGNGALGGKSTASFLLLSLLLLGLTGNDSDTRLLQAAEAFVAPTGGSGMKRSLHHNHNNNNHHNNHHNLGLQHDILLRRSSRTKTVGSVPLSLPSSRLLAMQQQYQDQEQEQEQQNEVGGNGETTDVERLLMDAERLRLEAEAMDANLTLQKISALEEKLSNDAWLKKQEGQTVKDLYEELRRLETKVSGPPDSTLRPEYSLGDKIEQMRESASASVSNGASSSSWTGEAARENSTSGYDGRSSSSSNQPKNRNLPPMAGFDDDDLKLYVPVAEDVNRMAPEAALDERIGLFRDAPELQEHFKEKIQRLIVGPLEEMQELETLKQEYFESSSSKEKEALLKRIKQLEAKVEENNIGSGIGNDGSGSGGIGYSDNILIPSDKFPPLTENELEERYETIKALPDILVAVYLQRNGLYELPDTYKTINLEVGSGGINVKVDAKNTSATNNNDNTNNNNANSEGSQDVVENNENNENGSSDANQIPGTDGSADTSFDLYENLKLAIQLDYYDLQMQLLNQARVIPLNDGMREEFITAYRSLPPQVREQYVVDKLGIDNLDASTITSDEDEDIEKVLKEVLQPMDEPFAAFSQAAVRGNQEQTAVPPEYNDVEFVDRSRYLEEFFPAVAALEEGRPTQEDVDLFVADCLNGSGKKSFMVTSKPERVIGGYYIRGANQIVATEEDPKTVNERLVEEVYERLQNHPTLKDKIDFFYISDPSPPSDEDLELEVNLNPLFMVTTKDPKTMYNLSSPLTKTAVTVSGLLSTFLFSIGSVVLNPQINTSIEKALDSVSTSASSTVYIDIDWFFNLCIPLYFSFLSIIFAHELGHRIVASIYKFDIGLPNVVPSLSTGLAGAITPLKSPPPSKKALFDFAIAGPLAGLAVSIGLLFVGLDLTRQMGLDTNFPVLPVDLVRASSLGGGMAQYFLGKYTLLADQGPGAFIELHPFAVSGLIGCLTNALALLPLGHTDGGRISLAMFGRRGAFVVKLFTTLILTASGLFGLDEVNMLLAYVVFTLVWQRELESPLRNEVDELSFSRGLVGIVTAVMVGLILIPMTS